jgi:hypothetical protein
LFNSFHIQNFPWALLIIFIVSEMKGDDDNFRYHTANQSTGTDDIEGFHTPTSNVGVLLFLIVLQVRVRECTCYLRRILCFDRNNTLIGHVSFA